jgi:hypothetical protein
MAVAVPKRSSSAPATAPPPSRTSPPKRRKAPAKGRPRKIDFNSGAAAPARVPVRKPATKPRRKTASPARRKPQRASAQPKLAVAVGRSATAIRGVPDSGLVVRMTRGRAWIAVLGVLLVGIVGLNVATLSFAASSGKIDEKNTALEQENVGLESRVGTVFGNGRMRHEAAAMGLAPSTTEQPVVINPGPNVVGEAAQRLAEAG